MRRLLVINPNTSSAVSRLLQQHAKQAAGDGVSVQTITARLGASYIADEASYAVAAHATLDAWAAALAAGVVPDAVLIGCFGDPGLLALRESSPVPVTGLAEGAFVVAMTTVRKGQAPAKLNRDEFHLVFSRDFYDPAFQNVGKELAAVEEVAWKNYVDSHKSPVTVKAGPALPIPTTTCRSSGRKPTTACWRPRPGRRIRPRAAASC
jgi:hypothetical protein